MQRRTSLLILAGAGVVALGVYAWLSLGAHRCHDSAANAAGLDAAIAEIETGRRTTPLVAGPTAGGDATVTFLAKRAGGPVPRVVSDVTGWGEHADGTFDIAAGTMTRVGRTDWYSLQASAALRARIEYLIADGPADYRLDPHNPRQAAGPKFGGLPASEFVTPGYRPPPEFADPPTSPAGATTEATVASRALGGSCRLIVYTPPGYRRDAAYPVAVFLDLRSGQVARVLDWLIAHHEVEPIVAVFVGPASSGDGHIEGAPLRAFLTGELPGWMASRYGVSRSASRRAILGISFGAKDALDAALASGGATGGFGRLGLLIPGRRIGRADIDAIAQQRTRQLRVAILAGRYDLANVATARSLRQALADAGHAVDCTEVPEGHSAVTWTHHVRDVLISLFGAGGRPSFGGEGGGGATAGSPRVRSCDDPARRRELRDNRSRRDAMSVIENQLSALGLSLPPPVRPPQGVVLPFRFVHVIGSRVLISGHGPQAADGGFAPPLGKVGAEVSLEQGYAAARLTALSILGSLQRALGNLDRIGAWVRIFGMVNSAPGFDKQPSVINGFSDLILELFGPEVGAHSRSAVGMAELPFNLPVEIEGEVELKPPGA